MAGREKAEEKAVHANCIFRPCFTQQITRRIGIWAGDMGGHGGHARMGGTSDLPACGI